MSKAKGFHKKPSKRITCKKRYRIEKKVRDHHKKMKKLAKKKGHSSSGKKKQVISMPRSAPFDLDWDGSTVPETNLKKIIVEAHIVVPSTVPSMDIESLVEKKSDADLVEGVPSSSSLSQQMTRRLKKIKSQGQTQDDADIDVDLVAEKSSGNKKKPAKKKNRRKPTPRQQKQGDYDVDRDFE